MTPRAPYPRPFPRPWPPADPSHGVGWRMMAGAVALALVIAAARLAFAAQVLS